MQLIRSGVHDLRNFLDAFSVALQLIERAPANAQATTVVWVNAAS
jgi:hypothetical protein